MIHISTIHRYLGGPSSQRRLSGVEGAAGSFVLQVAVQIATMAANVLQVAVHSLTFQVSASRSAGQPTRDRRIEEPRWSPVKGCRGFCVSSQFPSYFPFSGVAQILPTALSLILCHSA